MTAYLSKDIVRSLSRGDSGDVKVVQQYLPEVRELSTRMRLRIYVCIINSLCSSFTLRKSPLCATHVSHVETKGRIISFKDYLCKIRRRKYFSHSCAKRICTLLRVSDMHFLVSYVSCAIHASYFYLIMHAPCHFHRVRFIAHFTTRALSILWLLVLQLHICLFLLHVIHICF